MAKRKAGSGGLAKGVGFGDTVLKLRHILSNGDVGKRGMVLDQVRLNSRSPVRTWLDCSLAGDTLKWTKGGTEVIVYYFCCGTHFR